MAVCLCTIYRGSVWKDFDQRQQHDGCYADYWAHLAVKLLKLSIGSALEVTCVPSVLVSNAHALEHSPELPSVSGSWLLGKIHLQNDQLCDEWDVKLSYIASCVFWGFYVPTSIEKWCQRHSLFGSVRAWVRESVHSENLVNTISQKPTKGISLSFGHRCIWVHRCAD